MADSNQPVAASQPSAPQHGAITLFWYFSLFWTLGITALAVGAVWFQIINKFFPVEISYNVLSNSFNQDAVKSAIAALIVGGPVFFLFAWLIRRAIDKNEIELKKGGRMWIGYLILFVVVAIAVGDIITAVMRYLNGDFTTRFLLKSLTILVITAWVFVYFWLSLKSQDGLKTSPFPKIAVIVSAIVAVVSLVFGFTLVDTPQVARQKAYDRTREQDLTNIAYSIDNYYINNKALPATLSAILNYIVPADPYTKQAYTYTVGKSTSYQLCATFQTVSDPEQIKNAPYSQYSFVHETAGEKCFDLKAQDPAKGINQPQLIDKTTN